MRRCRLIGIGVGFLCGGLVGPAHAGPTVSNCSGEIQILAIDGTLKPPYAESVRIAVNPGGVTVAELPGFVRTSVDIRSLSDAQGLLRFDVVILSEFEEMPTKGRSDSVVSGSCDLTLSTALTPAEYNVYGFGILPDDPNQPDPVLKVDPLPAGLYHVYWGHHSQRWSGDLAISLGSDGVLYFPRDVVPASQEYQWINPAGGAYSEQMNWDRQSQYPVHNSGRSDQATFNLPTTSFLPIVGNGATAGIWKVSNSKVDFSGSAEVFNVAGSLLVLDQGQLRLSGNGSLLSVGSLISSVGIVESSVEVVDDAVWADNGEVRFGYGSVRVADRARASAGALRIGAGGGSGSVQVTGDAAAFDVAGAFVVGDTTAGTLEIDKGFFSNTSLSTPPAIGKSAPGTVTVRGDDSNLNSHGRLQTNHTLIVGDGASGRLNVQRGGHVSVAQDLVVSGYGASPAGEVVVDAQGGVNMLDVSGGIFVNATELQEILVQNGGRVTTNDLFIGNRQIRPGTADVTVRARSGSFPTLTVGTPGGGGAGTFVGDTVPGQLNVEFGALAELNNGLHVGEAAQGIVSVSRRELPPGTYAARLEVTGETQVGIGAPGIVQLDEEASMETNGDLLIGLGPGSPSGSVNVNSGSRIDVNGALAVGVSGVGVMNIVDEPSSFPSHVFCDTLVVGGNTPTATGIIVLSFVPNVPVSPHFSHLTVYGSTQVGVGPGRGEILLADASGRLEINGTMTIGNPAGGPGGSAVTLVDATIDGTGNIVVNPNGSLIGTGTVAVPKVDAGGHIAIARSGAPSPNGAAATKANGGGYIAAPVSPGTLTIDGDYEQLPAGVLVIEYAGENPGEFDVLHVTGQTTLGGRLEVHFRNGFSPEDPAAFIQSQDFVEADGIVTGDYDQRMYAFPDLFADFDDDGDRDLSDVAAFANCFAESGALSVECGRADWERDGLIGGREIQEVSARLTGP